MGVMMTLGIHHLFWSIPLGMLILLVWNRLRQGKSLSAIVRGEDEECEPWE